MIHQILDKELNQDQKFCACSYTLQITVGYIQSSGFSRLTKSDVVLLYFLLQELGAEKSKMASLEARLKAEQSARVQEVTGLQTRIQTADQEHLKHTQQLNQKVLII